MNRSAIVLLPAVIAAAVAKPLTLLVGYTGHGRTHICNLFDGTHCGDEHGGLGWNHGNCYVGNSFLDTPGFGDNNFSLTKATKVERDGTLPASLEILKRILVEVNSTELRAIMWVVNCGVVRPSGDEYALMQMFSQLIGQSIPIVAAFNVGPSGGHCVTDKPGFINMARGHGFTVSEIIEVEDFDLARFENKYSVAYQVMVDPKFQHHLQQLDAQGLAAKLEEFRKLQCVNLPTHLASIRVSMQQARDSIELETTVEPCVPTTCDHITSPQLKSCKQKQCVAWGESCDSFMFFEFDCDDYCAQYKFVEDVECTATNEVETTRYKDLLDSCLADVQQSLEDCEEARIDTLAAVRLRNSELESELQTLAEEEEHTSAKFRTCNNVEDGRDTASL